jgi:hypothetical protein
LLTRPEDEMRPSRTVLRASVLAACTVLAACSSAAQRPGPTLIAQPRAAFVPVPYPPPPARVEVVPAAPRPDAIWIGGEWDYRFRRWIWTYGRWIIPPSGARYARWKLVRDVRGEISFAPGSWRDAGGEVIEAPPALATARARENDVVEEDGSQQVVGPNREPPPPSPPDE